MNKYELVVIINAQMPQEQKDTIFKQTGDAVAKGGGKIVNSQVWFDRQKLTYSIRKCFEGTYYLIKFEALGLAIDKIKQVLKLNEEILRFGIYKSE